MNYFITLLYYIRVKERFNEIAKTSIENVLRIDLISLENVVYMLENEKSRVYFVICYSVTAISRGAWKEKSIRI